MMTMGPRIPSLYVVLALGLVTFYFYYLHLYSISTLDVTEDILASTGLTPTNSTLGFGAIYVVSGAGSSRKEGLIQSANVTELDLTFPKLPRWRQEHIDAFRDQDNLAESTILDGSIKAWLSHHIVLREFLKSGHETALIMEDDVDWDIRLRSQQVPAVAAAMRSLLPEVEDEEQYYWGHPQDWELLYLGHCGDYFNSVDGKSVGVGVVHPSDLDKVQHALFKDETLPDPSDIHPWTASLLAAFNIPAKTRVVHRSRFPLCTFGYAITRSTARRLMEEFAPPKEELHGEHFHAYDIAVLDACRDKGLTCYTINPELFHHMEGQSLIDGKTDEAGKPPADRAGTEQVRYRNETSNIDCGFYSKDFRWDGDEERLAYLREEVSNKGRCLKPGREEDEPSAPAEARL